MKDQKFKPKLCCICHTEFIPKSPKHKTCSNECNKIRYNNYHREYQREKYHVELYK